MATLPIDPLQEGGLTQFYQDFRSGTASSEQITQAYLTRIEHLDPRLQAYEYVDAKQALETAKAMDRLIASGVDLGPLMGVPIAIKDIFTIHQMPAPRAGSLLPLHELAGEKEGSFIQALRRLGCVFLGQTKAVELCLGITGVSAPLGTPWNPWDSTHQRVPGGSSSGSSVAVSAGLCAFAIGSDTGGSVRAPASFNGIFGLKTTFGTWPTDGVIPLDPRTDTLGLLTKSAVDAQTAYHAISSQLHGYQYDATPIPINLNRLHFGIPTNYFNDDLPESTSAALASAQQALFNTGVTFDELTIQEASEREGYFPLSLPASIIAAVGKQVLDDGAQKMDPIVRARVESGYQVSAAEILAIEEKRQKSIKQVKPVFNEFDAVVSATTVDIAPKLSQFDDADEALQLALGMTRNTQPANYLELCAVSLPLPRSKDELPLGYQLMGKAGDDARLLAIAVAVESVFGRSASPDLTHFIS